MHIFFDNGLLYEAHIELGSKVFDCYLVIFHCSPVGGVHRFLFLFFARWTSFSHRRYLVMKVDGLLFAELIVIFMFERYIS